MCSLFAQMRYSWRMWHGGMFVLFNLPYQILRISFVCPNMNPPCLIRIFPPWPRLSERFLLKTSSSSKCKVNSETNNTFLDPVRANIKHLMTGPEGNSEFRFPRISMFPETKSRETLRFQGNEIHCSPKDLLLSDLLHSKTKQKQILKNALRFQRQHQATSDHVKQRSTFRG